MSSQLLGALVLFILFVYIMVSKIPNWVGYFIMAPLAILLGCCTSGDVTGVLNSSTLHLLVIIGMFSGLIGAAHLDVPMGDFIDKITGGEDSHNKEIKTMILLFIFASFFSWFLQNNYLTLSLLPVLFTISKRQKVSHSKLILFTIFATTLGGACTLIGTPTNIFASAALQEVGLEPLKFFDFIFVGLPVMILGGIYMIAARKFFPSYEEELPEEYRGEVEKRELTKEERKKLKACAIAFISFVVSLALESLYGFFLPPFTWGYLMLVGMMLFGGFSPKEIIKCAKTDLIFQFSTSVLMVKIISNSGLSDLLGGFIANTLQGQTNLYLITAILFLGALLLTSFVNNKSTAMILAPIAISIANAMGANPQAMVLTIAVGAGCSFLTPFASATNYMLVPYTNLKFTDFIKAGLPLAVINCICCVVILPIFVDLYLKLTQD